MNRLATTAPAKGGSFKHTQQVDFIKQSITPRDFYLHELPTAKLKKANWNDGGLCPFHADNKAGSFHVNLATGAFKCFACGMTGGDVIAFAMALNGLKFTDALAKVADDWGLLNNAHKLHLTNVERRDFTIERQRKADERQVEEDAIHNSAANKATYIWGISTPAIDHPYLIKKRVKAHNLRQYKGALVVPIYNQNQQLVNLQFINADGTKRFLAGGKKKCCFSVIGIPNPDQQLLISEGLATGASLYEHTGYAVIVAMDAGNLAPVAKVN
jgi:phage/plasmid primase-like uncharacterized protein